MPYEGLRIATFTRTDQATALERFHRARVRIIWKTLRLALVGLAVGIVASLVLARLITSLFFETAPSDPITILATVALLAMVALLAGYLPALRASKIDPMVALRTN